MIHEDYCSYELSKALKAAGFDWPCDHYYTKENAADDEVWLTSEDVANWNANDVYPFFLKPLCSAPTQALAQKWLREVKGIHIVIRPIDIDSKWIYTIQIINSDTIIGDYVDYLSYEDALSSGITQAMDVIRK